MVESGEGGVPGGGGMGVGVESGFGNLGKEKAGGCKLERKIYNTTEKEKEIGRNHLQTAYRNLFHAKEENA